MLFSDPQLDMEITLALVFVSAFIGTIVGLIKRDWKIAIIIFSILSNLAFLMNIGSRMFTFYHIKWLKYVVVFIWPILNVFLIVWFFKRKKKER